MRKSLQYHTYGPVDFVKLVLDVGGCPKITGMKFLKDRFPRSKFQKERFLPFEAVLKTTLFWPQTEFDYEGIRLQVHSMFIVTDLQTTFNTGLCIEAVVVVNVTARTLLTTARKIVSLYHKRN